MPFDADNFSPPSKTPNWDRIRLSPGGHSGTFGADGVCAMELLGFVSSDEVLFLGVNVLRVDGFLRELVMSCNDRWSGDARQQLKKILPRLIGTNGGELAAHSRREVARRCYFDELTIADIEHLIELGPHGEGVSDEDLERRATKLLERYPNLAVEAPREDAVKISIGIATKLLGVTIVGGGAGGGPTVFDSCTWTGLPAPTTAAPAKVLEPA